MNKISSLIGDYAFLSNFWPAQVGLDGWIYYTVEHAYQAAKTNVPGERARIRAALSPGVAKKLGRRVALRGDWEEVKLDIMYDLLTQKFRDPRLGELLRNTGVAAIEEGNYWGDTFWGVYRGQGQNHLGKLLMQVRKDIS